jgi:sugar phosphate isomerase/epimerase
MALPGLMDIKILSPLWGHEQLDIEVFLQKINDAGYDGVDTWIPGDVSSQKKLLNYLNKHELVLVAHQHEASGKTFGEFKQSYLHHLQICADAKPLLINSHTGRDYFSVADNLALINIAQEFGYKHNIIIAHETHRGRLGSAPFSMADYFAAAPEYLLTADLSHWTCVTESMLEHFSAIVEEAILRTRHVHARVGYEQGPQVPDPRAPEWRYAVDAFFTWWDKMVEVNIKNKRNLLTFTTEFGPPPYLHTMPFTQQPVANQFEVNCYMKDLLRQRYAPYITP